MGVHFKTKLHQNLILGFGNSMIRLAVNAETPPEIRLAAAVNLKNFVKKNWVNLIY